MSELADNANNGSSDAIDDGLRRPARSVPELSQTCEHLAEAVRDWADSLGINAEYYDDRIEEGGSNEWGDNLKRSTRGALNTTLGSYTHLELADTAGVVASLPSFGQ